MSFHLGYDGALTFIFMSDKKVKRSFRRSQIKHKCRLCGVGFTVKQYANLSPYDNVRCASVCVACGHVFIEI